MTLDSLVFVTWKDTCCPAAPLWPLTSVWRKITRRGSSPWEFKLYAEWYNILLKVLIVKLKKKKKKSSHFLRAHCKRLSVWLWGRCNDKCVLWRAAEVIHLSFQQPLVTASNGIWWKTCPRMLSRRNKIKQGEIMLLLSHQALRMTAFYKRAIHCWKHDSSR